jgi:hypothetical protein
MLHAAYVAQWPAAPTLEERQHKAEADAREMMVDVLVSARDCPYLPGQPLYDELAPRTDVTDPECYGRTDAAADPAHWAEAWRDGCRECVREGLEERAIAEKETTSDQAANL